MDLIDRQNVINKICDAKCMIRRKFCTHLTPCEDVRIIESAPTVEPKRGEWIEYKDEFTHCHQCSICGGDAMGEGDENGMFFEVLTDICPHCGASMRGEKHETRADE